MMTYDSTDEICGCTLDDLSDQVDPPTSNLEHFDFNIAHVDTVIAVTCVARAKVRKEAIL